MFCPKILQQCLEKQIAASNSLGWQTAGSGAEKNNAFGSGLGLQHVLIFQNVEGSIVAKASHPAASGESDPLADSGSPAAHSLHSYAAVLANLCHEYIEFGREAFCNNKLKQISIQHGGSVLIVRPIWNEKMTFQSKVAGSRDGQKNGNGGAELQDQEQ